MRLLWQMWSGGMPENELNYINELSKLFEEKNSSMGYSGETNLPQHRISKVKWLNFKDNILQSILMNYINIANKNAFGFDINHYVEDIQHTTYYSEEKAKYDWHIDTFWANPTMQDRKLSMIIQLSDPDDYEGGNFELDPEYENPNPDDIKKKGTVFVFPSFIRHRVTPVISGTRKSLACFIEGTKFR